MSNRFGGSGFCPSLSGVFHYIRAFGWMAKACFKSARCTLATIG